ncbi:MAG: sensor histidine kinase [Actinomycetota bacterium]
MSQTERRLAALVEAGVALAADLDLDSLLLRIADLAREVVGAGYAAVGVVGPNKELTRFVYSGIDEELAERIGPLPVGRGVLGLLVDEARPLRLHEISEHPRSYGFPKEHPPMHSFLGVPIIVRGQIFGRLYMTEKEGAAEFSKDDERIALTLASQAGVAIENARLYDEVVSRGEEVARRVAEISSVERLADLLITESSSDTILAIAAEEAQKLTGASRTTVSLLDKATGDMIIREAVGQVDVSSLLGARMWPGTSKAHAVAERMTAEVVDDLQGDPEVHAEAIALLGSPRRGAFVPLIVRGEGVGEVAAYDRTGGAPFEESDLVILQVLANQVAVALENERLRESLRDLTVLEERERISKELHDGVIQSIYSVGLSLQGSMSLLEREPEMSRKRIDDAIAELDNVVRDVRSYIFELQPKSVQERGFTTAIEELVKDFEVNTLAHADVELDEDACSDLDESTKTHIVQIVREILSNIARHAQASEIDLSCSVADGELHLRVDDNGVGFDPSSVARGHGLTNMESRAAKLGGSIEIGPLEPKGTRHLLRLPRRAND